MLISVVLTVIRMTFHHNLPDMMGKTAEWRKTGCKTGERIKTRKGVLDIRQTTGWGKTRDTSWKETITWKERRCTCKTTTTNQTMTAWNQRGRSWSAGRSDNSGSSDVGSSSRRSSHISRSADMPWSSRGHKTQPWLAVHQRTVR